MKIQIDTTNKLVKVLEPAMLKDLTDLLKQMLGVEYDNYTIWFTSECITWYAPIYIPYTPLQPYTWPTITYTTASSDFSYSNGDILTPSYTGENNEVHIYNFDVQC